ncbi:MAG: phasin family protein [Sphingomonas sp.]|nr:phasin family protein [Sphingomonas sp.]
MSTQASEQIVAAQKAGLEAMFGFFETAMPGMERLLELNVQAVKTSVSEDRAVALEALNAKDLQAWVELTLRQAQANKEKVQAYWRHVSEIAMETGSELVAESQKHVNEYVRETGVVIDGLSSAAPVRGDAFFAFWTTGFEAARDMASAAAEQGRAAAKDAAEVIDKAGNRIYAR